MVYSGCWCILSRIEFCAYQQCVFIISPDCTFSSYSSSGERFYVFPLNVLEWPNSLPDIKKSSLTYKSTWSLPVQYFSLEHARSFKMFHAAIWYWRMRCFSALLCPIIQQLIWLHKHHSLICSVYCAPHTTTKEIFLSRSIGKLNQLVPK